MQNFLFDLDGTLTDPAEGITKSVQYALRKFGIEENDLEKLKCFIGPILVDSFYKYYGIPKDEGQKGVGYFREYFKDEGIFQNSIFPEVPDMLKSLKEKGKGIYIVTSKPEVFAERILEHFRVLCYFDYVAGNTLEETREKKEEVMAYLIEKTGIDPKDSIMVGDRKYDIRAGKQFGMKTLGAEFGFPEEGELVAAGADYIAKTPREMAEILVNL